MKKLRVVLGLLCAAVTLLAAGGALGAEPALKPNMLYQSISGTTDVGAMAADHAPRLGDESRSVGDWSWHVRCARRRR